MATITVSTNTLGRLAVTTNMNGQSSLAFLRDATNVNIVISDVQDATYARYFFVNNGAQTYSGYVTATDAGRYCSVNDPALPTFCPKAINETNLFNVLEINRAGSTVVVLRVLSDIYNGGTNLEAEVSAYADVVNDIFNTNNGALPIKIKFNIGDFSVVKTLDNELFLKYESAVATGGDMIEGKIRDSVLLLNHMNFKQFLIV